MTENLTGTTAIDTSHATDWVWPICNRVSFLEFSSRDMPKNLGFRVSLEKKIEAQAKSPFIHLWVAIVRESRISTCPFYGRKTSK